jgi:hypothetical protein
MIEASTQEHPMKDPLTYRYPRTTIEAFGCDATEARAGWRTINWTQIALDALSVVVVGGVLTALALAYFDVLVK